jgi:hypothetical protein
MTYYYYMLFIILFYFGQAPVPGSCAFELRFQFSQFSLQSAVCTCMIAMTSFAHVSAFIDVCKKKSFAFCNVDSRSYYFCMQLFRIIMPLHHSSLNHLSSPVLVFAYVAGKQKPAKASAGCNIRQEGGQYVKTHAYVLYTRFVYTCIHVKHSQNYAQTQ